MKYFLALILFLIPLHMAVKPVQAIADPPLFSCASIVGQNIANYSTGSHGVPGDTNTYTGQDTVFQVDPDHVLQCLCPNDSNTGIQSNWWKVTGLSQDDLDFFQRRGWVYVPNGAAWGLSDVPYLVKNDSFVCNGTGGGGSNGGSSTGVGGVNTAGSSAAPTGSILGVSNLAATGTLPNIVFYFGLSAVFGLAAYRVSKV